MDDVSNQTCETFSIMKNCTFALLMVLCLAAFCTAADYGKVTKTTVTDGVYLFTVAPYGDVGMSGNSIAIVNDDSVLVFDSTGTPETAATILSEIRKLTSNPVRYLVNSHWHWDHWGGNQVYLAAFPDLQIITHEKNLQMMREVEPDWNEEGLKVQLPAYLGSLEKSLAEAKTKKTATSEIAEMETLLKTDHNFLMQKLNLKKTYPNVTFSDSMTLQPAGREIQILHARAITPGDTFLFLPKEKILITGDVVLQPFPFAIGGTYPSEWLQTLQKMESLAPEIIVPGHGQLLHTDFLRNQMDLFQNIMNQTRECKSKGMTLEQTVDVIGAQSSKLAGILGITDEQILKEFRAYFLNIFITRAYKELDHPLGDSPRE